MATFLRSILGFVLVSICSLGSVCTAAATVRDDFNAALMATHCSGVENLNEATQLVLLSEWSGRSLVEMARKAGYSRQVDSLGDEDNFLPSDDTARQVALDGMAAVARDGTAALRRDYQAFGQKLCPLLTSDDLDFEAVLRSQRHANSPVRPFLAIGQRLAALHGCYDGSLDGAFGPATRSAWNRMTDAIAPALAKPDKSFPSPAEVLQVAGTETSAGACDGDHGAGATPLYSLLFTSTPLDERVQAVSKLGPTHLRNRASAALAVAAMQDVGDDDIVSQGNTVAAILWRLVGGDFAGFVQDLPASTGETYADDGLLTLAEHIMFGIGTDPQPAAARLLVEKLAGKSDNARLFLAGLTRCGASVGPGLPADAGASCTPDGNDRFQQYEAARGDAGRAAQFVRDSFARADKDQQTQGGGDDADSQSPAYERISVSVANWAEDERIARLAVQYPDAMAVIAAQPPQRQFIFGQMILEGRASETADRRLGLPLIAAAAQAGEPDAALRLAHIRRFGSFGATPDAAEAERLYKLAAAAGSAEAAFAIAEMHDTADAATNGFGVAQAWYGTAAKHYADSPEVWDLAAALQDRIVVGSPFLQSQAGSAWLAGAASKDDKLARAIADAFLCTSCGGVIDIPAAVTWYRRAAAASDEPSASLSLARLLIANPQYEKPKGEALQILRRNAPEKPAGEADDWYESGNWDALSWLYLKRLTLLQANVAPAAYDRQMRDALDFVCRVDHADACRTVALEMATGQWSGGLVHTGFDRLQELVKTADATDDYAAAALADAYATFGDYSDAIAALRGVASKPDDMKNSLPMLHRLVAAHLRRPASQLPAGMVDYIRVLAALGDEEAQSLDDMLAEADPSSGPEAIHPPPLDQAQSAFDQQLARGALSRGMVQAARSLSAAQRLAGDKEAALRSEFTALTTEMQLTGVDQMFEGSLPASLTRICQLSRSSERIAELGYDDAAITLAKYAVNELQQLRSELSATPEHLRTCFRDIAADNYRWLASLFVRQNRLAEARFVMGLLKDFETFEYVERDPAYARRSFSGFPLDRLESDFTGAITAIAVPLTERARWLAEMKWKARQTKLTAAELADVSKAEQQLVQATRAFQQQLDAAVAATASLGRFDKSAQIDSLKALQSFLRSNEHGKTAALHYIVLPDRLHVILTTSDLQISRTVDTLDGKPFDEAALNRKLDQFRAALQQPDDDPGPLARDLYQILIGPLATEIQAAGTKTLLISADRRLRYIPFAALHDGKAYLVQSYTIAALSDAGYDVAGDHRTGLAINALGMTKGDADFQPLPNVRTELDGIVKGDGGYGFLPGRVELDQNFTNTALKDALQFGPPGSGTLGIVHIASHFSLGSTDRTSRLLLGDGSLLSLADIKGDKFSYDFGSVDLLTLSACSTAYGLSGSDGRDLDSFAEISRRGGARSIVASLWPVSDASTSILMQRFYEVHERRNLGKAEALATVQREFAEGKIGEGDGAASVVIETARRGAISADSATPAPVKLDGFRHPFYWAPFVIMGNWQ